MITAQSKEKQLQTLFRQSQQEVSLKYEQLKKVVQIDTIVIENTLLIKLELKTISTKNNIGLQYFESSKDYYKAKYQQEKQNLLPDLSVEYFQGTNSTLPGNINGYQFGVKIPLLFGGNASKINASKIAQQIVAQQQIDYKINLDAEYNKLLAELQQYNEAIDYYNTQAKHLSKEIIKTAESSFKNGEIDFFQYIQSIENAKDIELTYLENLNRYNQTIIAINFLIL
jgi:cobalt-zinc-cadmium resistance protein CzcA